MKECERGEGKGSEGALTPIGGEGCVPAYVDCSPVRRLFTFRSRCECGVNNSRRGRLFPVGQVCRLAMFRSGSVCIPDLRRETVADWGDSGWKRPYHIIDCNEETSQ